MRDSLIQVEGLTKSFGGRVTAIRGVSFDVKDGEVVGFVGLNGAGKTTTIRVAAGVSLPTGGTVTIDGNDVVRQKAAASRLVGWVPEIPNFEPDARALSLMRYFYGFYGIPGPAKAKSLELLKSVGLAGDEGKKFRTYSQGMKKRFSLAVSMLPDPRNFLFDEILNGLDPEGIQYFRSTVVQFKKEGRAVLLSSHILAEVQALADRVVFIHKGRVIRVAQASEISSLGVAAIVVSIENLDERALDFLKGFGEVRVDGKTVRVLSASADPAELNSGLVSRGYTVSGIFREKTGLEEAFFRLIQEAEGGPRG